MADVLILKPRNSNIWQRAGRDFYTEPRWCSERLFTKESFTGEIIDPACGTGRIVEAARAHHHCAVGYDIRDGHDFFENDQIAANYVFNPPFGKRGATARLFILHALRLARYKVCAIYPTASIHAAHCWLKDTPLARIWLMTPRPSMPPGELIERGEKAGGGRMDFSWLVFVHGHVGPPTVGWLHRDQTS
jgi:hypothetical protein